MRPHRFQFRVRWLLMSVALIACVLGLANANALTTWAALFGIPLTLIAGRGVPFRRTIRVLAQFFGWGLPAAAVFGLLNFPFTGVVGLVGGCTLLVLVIGWGALLTAGLSVDPPATTQDSFDLLARMSSEGGTAGPGDPERRPGAPAR